MGKFTDFTKKVTKKVTTIIKDEIKERQKFRIEVVELSNKELKELAINKGQPYEDEYIKRMESKKRLEESLNKI